MNKQPIAFGQWLKKLRAEQDLTQEMLSDLISCASTTVRAFEIGKRRPSRELAERLADVLKVPTDQRSDFLRLARQTVEGSQEEPNEAAPLIEQITTTTPTLPPLAEPLIGREAESNALVTLLGNAYSRLVTIVGAGGMGKTRLALEVANRLAAHFADGVVFVSLASLHSAAQLPDAIASVLQLTLGSEEPGEQVLRALATRHLLMVLDSFEELLQHEEAEATAWVNLLLQRSTRLQLLITSRERLRLGHEHTFELGGLSLPRSALAPERSDAELLFLERAQQAAPDFQLEAGNRSAVVRICQLMDGMPLGIELAAAWVNVLTPDEIANEIASNIDFLTRVNRDASPRHRSMRAVCDHSWALLNGEERQILERLAVFRGGCNREAAQRVARAALPKLAGLIDKSLVRLQQRERQTRYDLHEVVRQYADEKRQVTPLGSSSSHTPLSGLEQDEAWLAHYTYFYQLAATAKLHLLGSTQLQWLNILDQEHDNLRAALDRCLLTHDFARGLQLAIQLEEYWFTRGYHGEGLQWLRSFLERESSSLSEHDRALGYAASTILAIASGNYALARACLERSIGTIRRLGDQALLARVLRNQGLIALYEGDYTIAETLANESISAAQVVNNHFEVATTLGHLTAIALIQQNYVQAKESSLEAVRILRLLDDKNQLAGALRRLAQARIPLGELEEAQDEALESFRLNKEVGDLRGIAASIVILATLLAARQRWSEVAQLLGAATALLSRALSSLFPTDQLVYDELWQQSREDAADFQTMYDQGRVLAEQEQKPPYHLDWIEQLVTTNVSSDFSLTG